MKFLILFVITLNLAIAQEGYVDSTKIRNPKIAWKLGLIPGVGQLYNGKYFKAFSTMTAEYVAVNKFNIYKDLKHIGMRNTYAWWIVGIYVWSILDAYVDAHLSTFPNKHLKSKNELDSLRVNGN